MMLAVIGWKGLLSVGLTMATLVILVVWRERFHKRLIAGLLLLMGASFLSTIEEIMGLGVDNPLLGIGLPGLSLIPILSIWMTYDERSIESS